MKEAKDIGFRILKTKVYVDGFLPTFKTFKTIQYLDPVEGWTDLPIEYKYLGFDS